MALSNRGYHSNLSYACIFTQAIDRIGRQSIPRSFHLSCRNKLVWKIHALQNRILETIANSETQFYLIRDKKQNIISNPPAIETGEIYAKSIPLLWLSQR